MIEYANDLIEEIKRLKPSDAISIRTNGYEISRVIYEGSHIDIVTDENKDLLLQIQELENERDELEDELNDTECERDNIEDELEDLQRTNEDLTEQRDFYLKRVKDLELENEKLKAEIKRLQNQIETDNDDMLF